MAEVAEADRVVVDRVDRDEHVDQLLGAAARLVVRERRDVGAGAQDVAVDELHHVEGRVVDRDVVAEARSSSAPAPRSARARSAPCTRGPCRARSGSTCPSGGRRSTHCVLGVADRVGEVRATAGDERRGELAAGRAVDVRGEPRSQSFEVDPGRRVRHGREVTERMSAGAGPADEVGEPCHAMRDSRGATGSPLPRG